MRLAEVALRAILSLAGPGAAPPERLELLAEDAELAAELADGEPFEGPAAKEAAALALVAIASGETGFRARWIDCAEGGDEGRSVSAFQLMPEVTDAAARMLAAMKPTAPATPHTARGRHAAGSSPEDLSDRQQCGQVRQDPHRCALVHQSLDNAAPRARAAQGAPAVARARLEVHCGASRGSARAATSSARAPRWPRGTRSACSGTTPRGAPGARRAGGSSATRPGRARARRAPARRTAHAGSASRSRPASSARLEPGARR